MFVVVAFDVTTNEESVAASSLTSCKFSKLQVFDVQWNISGSNLNISGINRPYLGTGRMTDAQILSTDYFQFFDSTTVNGSYGMNHFSSEGTLKTAMYTTGTFRAMGADFIFFLGNGSWGTVITTTSGYAYGSSVVLPITTQNPSNASMATYGGCSSTPATAVGTIPTTTTTSTVASTTTTTTTTTTTVASTTTTTTIPATTTTTTTTTIPATTTTTTTTIAPATTTTTTVAPANTASSSVPTATVATLPASTPSAVVVASTTAPAPAQVSTVTAPQVLSAGASTTTTTTPIRATSSNATAATVVGSIPTTTVAPTTTTTVATGNDAPLAEDAVSSVPQDQAVAVINGKTKKVLVIRSAAKMQASVGTIVMDLTATTKDGNPISLDEDGNLLVQPGDVVELRLAGLLGASESEVWLYSTPQKIGSVLVGADGEAAFAYAVPESLEEGEHRIVLSGQSVLGDTVTVGLPLRAVEGEKSGGNLFQSSPVIWLILGLFVVIGLFLPSQIRRRRS
jgi:hypothetical protein